MRAMSCLLFHARALLGFTVSYVYLTMGTYATTTATPTKTSLEYKFVLLVLLCAYSNSFNLYNVAALSSNKTRGNGL